MLQLSPREYRLKRVSPNKITKSIESPVAKLLENVRVDELTVKLDPGFWITPFKLHSIWLADSGTTFTESTCIV